MEIQWKISISDKEKSFKVFSYLEASSYRTRLEQFHLTLRSYTELLERLAPSFAVGNFAERFALLLPFAKPPNRVAKGNNSQDLDLRRNTQYGIDLLEVTKANPV